MGYPSMVLLWDLNFDQMLGSAPEGRPSRRCASSCASRRPAAASPAGAGLPRQRVDAVRRRGAGTARGPRLGRRAAASAACAVAADCHVHAASAGGVRVRVGRRRGDRARGVGGAGILGVGVGRRCTGAAGGFGRRRRPDRLRGRAAPGAAHLRGAPGARGARRRRRGAASARRGRAAARGRASRGR